jgi:polyribonucleotide nucleotidyltransferase
MEGIMDDILADGRFMLHYNFPPFSVGEVKPMRGPGRRDVGHGYLAASALRAMLPSKEEFPYTIRVVADILESNGSSSMATTCGGTMSLMHAGVPIKKMVSGIAMGLLMNKKGEFRVLSDLTGFEDEFGLMDFKVTGTDGGITAIQMDSKYKGGLSREILQAALEQSKRGRLHILGEMQKVMSKPNAELSDLVPKLISFKIAPDKIGAVIGTGGKTIKEIIEKTRTTIDIESDGLVKIFGGPDSEQDTAVNWVKTLAGQIEIGSVWEGKVRRVVEFGMFVELVPGQDGLVHISNIPREKQKDIARDYPIDSVVKVAVDDYDPATGRIRLRLLKS